MLSETEIEKIQQFVPLDKSWIIRMGILDLINGYFDINRFLESQQDLGGDLQALQRVSGSWKDTSMPIDVGESGTIYRFVKFYDWKNNLDRQIKISDTLIERVKRGVICNDPKIVNFSPEQLLELDNKTSQWATMAYLLGDQRKVENPPFKLHVTYYAVEQWRDARKKGKVWGARKDSTILNQALAFAEYLKTGRVNFKPAQAEDYCFARAFNILTREQGRKLYPSLEGHETNRIDEMEKCLIEVKSDKKISSEDHRVVQAIAMRYFPNMGRSKFVKPYCVIKTWPKFWEFQGYCRES